MDWQTKATLPKRKKGQILIAAQDKKSKNFQYAVVFWYQPTKVWYGSGFVMKTEDIKWWADIPPPGPGGRKRTAR